MTTASNLDIRGVDRTRRTRMAAAAILALAIAGCAGTKDGYPAMAEAQQRQAAEETANSKLGSTIDTQATYLKLVDQMQQEGLWFASLAHIDALEQRWGATPESTRARAEALRHADQTEASATAYKRLFGTPLEGAGYRGLGLLAGVRGDYPQAVRMLKEAQRRNPTDALLLNDLGYAALRAGQIEEARLPLMQALQLKPDNLQAQANLALYLEATQQREKAASLMDANKMSPATRAAIRDAARQLVAAAPASGIGLSPLPASVAASPAINSAIASDATPPLALKASRSAAFSPSGPTSKGSP